MNRPLLSALALAAGLLLAAGPARAVTLTFDDLAVGTTLGAQYAALGATFSANAFSGAGTSTSGQAWASNTDMTVVSAASTDVGSLGSPSLVGGNLLRSYDGWLNENGDASFRISFAAPVGSFSATFAGVATPADVRLYAYNGSTLLGSVAGTATGQFVLGYSAASITSVVVTPGSYDDWVGVDNVSFAAAVPEPTTYALLALGLGVIALRRRT